MCKEKDAKKKVPAQAVPCSPAPDRPFSPRNNSALKQTSTLSDSKKLDAKFTSLLHQNTRKIESFIKVALEGNTRNLVTLNLGQVTWMTSSCLPHHTNERALTDLTCPCRFSVAPGFKPTTCRR
ncbi:hypothetical protein TNCV_1353831 [Trichonephila clavipes]|nr:hypothetical protein TNCV_1353831 [Trichonephila clavipes]